MHVKNAGGAGMLQQDVHIKKIARTALPAGMALAGAVIGFAVLTSHGEKFLFLAFPALLVPAAVAYLLALHSIEERKKKLEDEIPDMLLLASSLPGHSTIPKIIGFMASNGSGPLSWEFRRAEKEIAAGIPIESALDSMAARNGSAALDRAIGMINVALDSGAEMSRAFRETAEDFMQTHAITRERASAMAVQKYTLLAAGGFLVPFILGKLGSMAEGFSVSAVSGLGIGATEGQRLALASAASLASATYIAEFTVIAAMFIGLQEGRPKKAALYALALLPAGLGVYFLSRGGV